MQQDNNLHKLLRDLDDHQEPDLSGIEAHWEEMHKLLKPVVVTPGRPFSKMLAGKMALIIIVGICLLYLFMFKKETGKNINTAAAQVVVVKNTVVVDKDTIETLKDTVLVQAVNKTASYPILATVKKATVTSEYFSEIDSIVANMKINFTPCETCPGEKADSLASDAKNRLILQQFFDELQSPAQEFVINNNSDTNLVCINGTSITIPALSFADKNKLLVNGEIKIQIREFYSYADIVSSKLSTQSNGNQLVSGGMLHITAIQGDKELKLLPAKQLTVKMPTNGNFDEDMQLFTDANHSSVPGGIMDTTDNINWVPAGQFQRLNRSRFMIKTFDPYGQPYKIFEKKDGSTVAKFMIARNCPMKNEDVLKGLKGHFGMFYNSIKLKRSWSNHPKALFSKEAYPLVGDSVMMDFAVAKQLNLLSAAEIANYEKLLLQDSLALDVKRRQTVFYEFQLSNLGYMNCDRFRNDGRPKVDYTFNFSDGPANSFYSVLVFDSYRSVAGGEFFGNKLKFRGLPVNEKVHLVSVGVKNGKVMSCIRPLVIDGSAPADVEFTETSPAAFKSQLKGLQLQ